MALIVDFLLLAASGAACFYCWVLNGRIKSLTNTKDGIHSGIAALSQSADEMQTAMADTKKTATENTATLDGLLQEADKRIPELRELLQQITAISQHAVEETEGAAKGLIEILKPHIDEARDVSTQLLDALEKEAVTRPQASSDDNTITAPEETDDSEEHKEEDIQIEIIVDGDGNAKNAGKSSQSGEAA